MEKWEQDWDQGLRAEVLEILQTVRSPGSEQHQTEDQVQPRQGVPRPAERLDRPAEVITRGMG